MTDEPFPVPALDDDPVVSPAPERVDGRKRERTPAQVAAAKANLKKGIEASRARKGKPMGPRKAKGDKGEPTTTKRNAPAADDAPVDTRLMAEARASLKRWRAEVGAGGLMIAPVPATYIARTDDEVIEAAVRLAGRNAKFLEAIAQGGDVLAAIVVLRWAAGLGVAVAVNIGRVSPDTVIAQSFGITGIVDELTAEGLVQVAEEQGSDGGDDATGSVEDHGAAAPAVALIP